MRIPSELRAGDSCSWNDDPAQDNNGNAIAPPDWALKYYLRGKSKLDVTASQSGNAWQVTITADQTTGLDPGVYYWQARAEKGSEAVTLGSGRTRILPSLSAAAENFDGRSQATKDLEAVRGAIRAIIAKGAVQEYSIAGRQLRTYMLTDLLVLEARYAAMVGREDKAQKIANGEGDPHTLYVRFTKT
jgi:hypothetical protein